MFIDGVMDFHGTVENWSEQLDALRVKTDGSDGRRRMSYLS